MIRHMQKGSGSTGFGAGDIIPIGNGGTGADSIEEARTNLGVTQEWVQEQIPDRVTVVANKTILLTDHADLQAAFDESLRWHSLEGFIYIKLPAGETVVPPNIRCKHPQKIRVLGHNTGAAPPRRADLTNDPAYDLAVAQGIHDSELVPHPTLSTASMFYLVNFNDLEIYGVLLNMGFTSNYAFYGSGLTTHTSLSLVNTTIYGSVYGIYASNIQVTVNKVTIMHSVSRGLFLTDNNSIKGNELSILYTVTGIYNQQRSWLTLSNTEIEVTGVTMYSQYGSHNYFLGGYFKGVGTYLMQAYSGVHLTIYSTVSYPTTLVGTSFCYAYYDSRFVMVGGDPAHLDVTGLTTYFVRGLYESIVFLTPAIANQPHIICRLDYRSTGSGSDIAGTTVISPAAGADGNNDSRWY